MSRLDWKDWAGKGRCLSLWHLLFFFPSRWVFRAHSPASWCIRPLPSRRVRVRMRAVYAQCRVFNCTPPPLSPPLLLRPPTKVYGDPEEHPQRETYWGNVNPIGPRACYDEGKRVAETMMYAYEKQVRVERAEDYCLISTPPGRYTI